jgi:hypothetical protein
MLRILRTEVLHSPGLLLILPWERRATQLPKARSGMADFRLACPPILLTVNAIAARSYLDWDGT